MKARQILFAVGAALALALSAMPADADPYTGALTFVARTNGFVPADNGVVVCDPGTGGAGGACIAWDGASDSVLVSDVLAGLDVAYQVCVDNDGDGVCVERSPLLPGCDDQIFFSHADGGAFFNPLGPLPTSFLPGCPGGFPGWVVFLCTGVHDDGAAHTHDATDGTVVGTTGGTGYGNFCGGGNATGERNNTAAKAYIVAHTPDSTVPPPILGGDIVITGGENGKTNVETPFGWRCTTSSGATNQSRTYKVTCEPPPNPLFAWKCVATTVRVAAAGPGGAVVGRSECPGVVSACGVASPGACFNAAAGLAPPVWTCTATEFFGPLFPAPRPWVVRCTAFFIDPPEG